MKNIYLVLFQALLYSFTPLFGWACDGNKTIIEDSDTIQKEVLRVTVASFNVLTIDKDETNAEQFGGTIRHWNNRKETVANIIKRHKFSVIGVQELNHDSMKDDLAVLLPEYAFTEDAKDDPIFWLKDDFTLLDKGEFLADNGPYSLADKPSPYWGKHVVWVKLKENKYNKEFFVFNGHPVHNTDKALYRSAFARELVRQEKLINNHNLPVFIAGDLNAYDERGSDEQSARYNEIFGEAGFKNAMLIARLSVNEEYGTWAGFGKPGNYAWLDRIYVSGKEDAQVIVNKYEAIIDFDPDRPGYRNEPIPSDHFPIYVNLELIYK